MGCCGKEDISDQVGVNATRKCRDVLFLLAFIGFWGGMYVVCGIAFSKGNASRLVYGTDKYGNLCGSKNGAVDMTSRRNLYYLNPLELLDLTSIPFAKSVCLDTCPGAADTCSFAQLAAGSCTATNQYRCPYYAQAEYSLNGKLTTLSTTTDAYNTAYYGNLAPHTSATCDNTFLTAVTNSAAFSSISSLTSLATCPNYYKLLSMWPGRGPCYPIYASTTSYFNRCFPTLNASFVASVASSGGAALPSDSGDKLTSYYQSAGQKWSNYVADISKGILIIVVGGLVGGIVISMLWMIVLRYFAGAMVWFTIFAVNALFLGITLWCWAQSGKLGGTGWGDSINGAFSGVQAPNSLDTTSWLYIAYGATAFTCLLLLLTLLMISRVKVAVACLKVASQAVGSMPSVLLFPILPFIFEVGLIVYWVAVTAMLYSAGNLTYNFRDATAYSPLKISAFSLGASDPAVPPAPTKPADWDTYTSDAKSAFCASSADCYTSYAWDDQLKYAFVYHFFGLLWTNQFIVGFSCVVIAGAIGSYYWSRGDPDQMPRLPVVRALRNAAIYHLGSIALGSFIVAVIQMIRFALEYLDKKTKKVQEENAAARWALWCCKCLVWCLEKIMKFINKNAYILVAVKGTGYCASAARAIKLILANALRLAVVNVVGDALIILGKLCVAAGAGLIAFAMSNSAYYNDAKNYPETYLSSAILPIALAVLVGYVVAQIFFSVYDMAIDTVMLSFCEDCEAHDGTPQYAPPLLMEVMNASYPADGDKK